MAVLTLKGEEIKTFPPILREYSTHLAVIKGNSEKTVCEYLLDLRTFFRFCKVKDGNIPPLDEFEKIGIEDITLAMREGYSTAPDAVRSLGFGAGMGLPNMKRHTDSIHIDSTVGVGTRIVMKVNNR